MNERDQNRDTKQQPVSFMANEHTERRLFIESHGHATMIESATGKVLACEVWNRIENGILTRGETWVDVTHMKSAQLREWLGY